MMGEGLGEPPLGTLNILVNSLVLPQNHLCILVLHKICSKVRKKKLNSKSLGKSI